METVRIYAILEDVGSEYETIVPTKISLKPLGEDCYFIDMEDSECYNTDMDYNMWIPYNTTFN